MTTDQKPNKEQVYDDQISPLMTQIIAIAQANGIAMLANFAIDSDDDEGLRCTTCVPDGDGNHPDDNKRAMAALKGGGGILAAFTITAPKA